MAADEAANSKPEKLLTNLHNLLKSRIAFQVAFQVVWLESFFFAVDEDENDNEGHF